MNNRSFCVARPILQLFDKNERTFIVHLFYEKIRQDTAVYNRADGSDL